MPGQRASARELYVPTGHSPKSNEAHNFMLVFHRTAGVACRQDRTHRKRVMPWGCGKDFMRISPRRSYYWLEQHVFGLALIEIVAAVCACIGFVILVFKVLKHFGIQ
jgi:hypothetical protein